MSPEQSEALIALAERMLLRDLAGLAAIRAEQTRLSALAEVEAERAKAEQAALPADADHTARLVLDQFLTAAAGRRDALIAQAAALNEASEQARRTAEQAFGRKKGLELLSKRSECARAEKAARAEERTLSAVAAVQSVSRRTESTLASPQQT